jgi:site-specific DNA-methyltransferase (adenine-specific)
MTKGTETEIKDHGRFPANVVHDGSEEVVLSFPEGSHNVPTMRKSDGGNKIYGKGAGDYSEGDVRPAYSDEGSAARYFKECKS